MEANRAAENLQTIRTLMERSALYRRALAPIMTFCGAMGIVGGVAGWLFKIDSARGFVLLWGGVAVVALTGSFLLARRQALRDAEPFWSPPTRRVVLALWPPLLAGLVLGLAHFFFWGWSGPQFRDNCTLTVVIWITFYGCAMHSAGFFMPRGIKIFGLGFILCGCAVFIWALQNQYSEFFPNPNAQHYSWSFPNVHALMALFFGGLHLAYGIYLYLTERKDSAA